MAMLPMSKLPLIPMVRRMLHLLLSHLTMAMDKVLVMALLLHHRRRMLVMRGMLLPAVRSTIRANIKDIGRCSLNLDKIILWLLLHEVFYF